MTLFFAPVCLPQIAVLFYVCNMTPFSQSNHVVTCASVFVLRYSIADIAFQIVSALARRLHRQNDAVPMVAYIEMTLARFGMLSGCDFINRQWRC